MNEVINLLNEANNAAKESDMFKHEGIYITIREGEDIIRKRFFPGDIHKLSEDQVKDMAFEFAHTILKIKKRKQDKDADAKEETNGL